MRRILECLAFACISFAVSNNAQAVPFSPEFDVPSFPGSQFTVDAAHNAYYSTNYGITVSNTYLYVDPRDTFDGVGIANGTVAGIGTFQSGRLDFLDRTDFVTINYVALENTTYEAFSSTGAAISSFSATPGVGTFSFTGGIISFLTFSTTGGNAGISGLRYNYDGKTDGQNTDINPVPEPASIFLLGAGLAGLGIWRRKQV